MSDELAFIREIQTLPQDDMPRLIFADFLEDQGDPRAALIRVQCRLAGLPPGSPEAAELVREEQALLDEHAERWLAPLRSWGAIGLSRSCFQRGLIEHARLPAAAFINNIAAICEREPALRRVALRDVLSQTDALQAAEIPTQVCELDVSSNHLNAAALAKLARAGWTEQITLFDVSFNPLGAEGLKALLDGRWPAVERLNLSRTSLEKVAASDVIGWRNGCRFVNLSLAMNPLHGSSMHALFDHAGVETLSELDLSSCGLDLGDFKVLLRSPYLRHLRTLSLRSNRLDHEACQLLADCQHMQLSRIDLRSSLRAVQTYGVQTEDKLSGPLQKLRDRFQDGLLA